MFAAEAAVFVGLVCAPGDAVGLAEAVCALTAGVTDGVDLGVGVTVEVRALCDEALLFEDCEAALSVLLCGDVSVRSFAVFDPDAELFAAFA